MKKFLLLAVVILLALVMTIAVLANDSQPQLKYDNDGTPLFSDIDYEKDSFAQSVSILAKAGIVSGFPDGTFRPDNGLTRAEFCKMVNLIFGYDKADEEPFIDISREDIHCWFYDIAMVAKKAGYIKGYEDNSFRGDNKLTREETCTVLNRLLKLYALPLSGMEVTDEVSDWAVEDVKAVVTNFIMPLEEGNTFRATEIIKRSEVIVVLANLYTARQEELEKDEEKDDNTGSSSGNSGTSGGTTGGSSAGGDDSTGDDNTGDNAGDNTGDDNTGDDNTGDDNTGDDNTGDNNTGDDNTGNDNTGGSTGGDDAGDDNTGDEMTREEIDAANKPVLDNLAIARSDISTMRVTNKERQIRTLLFQGFDGVTADAQSGILITPEYVNEKYASIIDQAVAIYEGMTESAQGSFREKLASTVNSQAMSFLLDYFPLERFI